MKDSRTLEDLIDMYGSIENVAKHYADTGRFIYHPKLKKWIEIVTPGNLQR